MEWFLGIYHTDSSSEDAIRCKLWDTTNQEKYIREVAPKSFFKSIDSVAIVWDASSE